MYKILNNLAPDYLINLLPAQVGHGNNYNLRNRENFNIPLCRTSLFYSSFIPSTINKWNNLPLSTRNCPSLPQFKSKLKTDYRRCSAYFDYGDRKLNVLHTRLRHGCSTLNGDLHRVNLINTSVCSCGFSDERTNHYFLHCRNYDAIRHELFSKLNEIGVVPDIGNILYGCPDFTYTYNNKIFQAVHRFIHKSKRFK